MFDIEERQRFVRIRSIDGEDLRIFYREAVPKKEACNGEDDGRYKLAILIHGFPQTSYCYRHLMPSLARAGYHVIAPDYRGAGRSSKPICGYDKLTMADDLVRAMRLILQRPLPPFDVVGQGVGCMIAHSMATAPEMSTHVRSLTMTQVILPDGIETEEVEAYTRLASHLLRDGVLHLQDYFDEHLVNAAAITPADLQHYATAFDSPSAKHAALTMNDEILSNDVKWIFDNEPTDPKDCSNTPVLLMIAELPDYGYHDQRKRLMSHESIRFGQNSEEGYWTLRSNYHRVRKVRLADCKSYLAEEIPNEFAEVVLGFWERHVNDEARA